MGLNDLVGSSYSEFLHFVGAGLFVEMLVEGGMLRAMAGQDVVKVNSLHSQAVAKLADGVTIEAVADDGLIEGFRGDGAKAFALAVQWHPE